MFNTFIKKKSKEKKTNNEIRGYIVPKTMVKKFEPKKFEPKKFELEKFEFTKFEPKRNYFKIKYRDIKTGEIFVIDMNDDEAYDKMMNNQNAQMIFD